MHLIVIWYLLIIISLVGGDIFNKTKRDLFPLITNDIEYTNNELCQKHNELYRNQLENLTLWAHEMWDATAKYPSGVLRGSVFSTGDWDECITIAGPYRTQYCIASIIVDIPRLITPRDPLSLHFSPYENVLNKLYKTEEPTMQSRHSIQMGICTSAACSSNDLEIFLNKYVKQIENPLEDRNITYHAKVSKELCQTDDDRRHFDGVDASFCFVVLIIIALVLLSTFYDYRIKSKKRARNKPRNIYLAFSARKNFLDLARADESNPALKILYGMKTFCICMIIMDHRFGTFLSGPLINYDYVEQEYRSTYAAFLFHGDLFVDTFFILSGLLVTYCLLIQFEKKVINPFFILLMRYLRLTPTYAFVIFYWASIFYHIGSGPLWKLMIGSEVQDCRTNFWLNLLYVSNYVNPENMCMTHSWYLPCDFHFFIIGVLVTLLLNKHKKAGLILLALLFLISIIVPFVLVMIYSRPAFLLFYPNVLQNPKRHPDFQISYIHSHLRLVSYVIGMFAGYVYYRLKNSTKHLSKSSSHILTIGSLIVLFATVLTGTVFFNRYHVYNALESATYAALHRVGWCFGTLGLLFSASYGHASILKSALSWSPWIPLGKLVYGAYLIHISFQLRSVAMTITPKYFCYFDVISLTLSDIVLAFAASLLLYLGIEAPMRTIFKELLTPKQSSARNHKQVTTEMNNMPNTLRSNNV